MHDLLRIKLLNCLHLLLFLLLYAPAQCPTGSHTFNNTACFQIFDDKRSWEEARDHCKSQSSHLAKVSSDEMLRFLTERLPTERPTNWHWYWIGASLAHKWRWDGGK